MTTAIVTGSNGFIGSAVVRNLRSKGVEVVEVSRMDCHENWPLVDAVFHCAGFVGGIHLNQTRPADLMSANWRLLDTALTLTVNSGSLRFVNLGSVCSYPAMRDSQTFLNVPDLWKGRPEASNAPYGLAKRAGMELVDAYGTQYGIKGINLILANVYGPGAKTGKDAHVIPALIGRFLDAKERGLPEVVVWGTGKAEREFLYISDAAEAITHLGLEVQGADTINVGSGEVVTVADLAHMIQRATAYEGRLRWDTSKPDSRTRRLLNSGEARGHYGWTPKVNLATGVELTVAAMENDASANRSLSYSR